jgi:D-beta-D-heptose 7-phosphate kinase/D-beta-D-heptose 1-phosphate adenosyltransferase
MELPSRIKGKRVLVIGDSALDIDIHGKIERTSPEAPIPVFLETGRAYRSGMAAKVASSVVRYGGSATLIRDSANDADNTNLIGVYQRDGIWPSF